MLISLLYKIFKREQGRAYSTVSETVLLTELIQRVVVRDKVRLWEAQSDTVMLNEWRPWMPCG